MKLKYTLRIMEDYEVTIDGNIYPFKVDNADVIWIIDGNFLKGASIVFKEVPLVVNEGVFNPIYPEIHALAYKIATYLNNRLLSYVGLDAFYSPGTILNSTPEVILENSDEENKWKECVKQGFFSIPCTAIVVYPFKAEKYAEHFSHSCVYTYYADAMRASSPFLKYELFYKIVEYFFEKNGSVRDKDVSDFAMPKDNRFNESLCKAIREMRNKITHPHAKLGHANPENLEDIYEVCNLLEILRDLTNLLLKFPPE